MAKLQCPLEKPSIAPDSRHFNPEQEHAVCAHKRKVAHGCSKINHKDAADGIVTIYWPTPHRPTVAPQIPFHQSVKLPSVWDFAMRSVEIYSLQSTCPWPFTLLWLHSSYFSWGALTTSQKGSANVLLSLTYWCIVKKYRLKFCVLLDPSKHIFNEFVDGKFWC